MTQVYEENAQADELEDDEYVMPTLEHGAIEINVGGELRSFIKGKNLGRVFGSSAEYRFGKGTSETRRAGRQPDISFVTQDHLPTRLRGYPDFAPDLAIEIISPNDKPYEIDARTQQYQDSGVQLVWIINPFSRTVDVYRQKEGFKLQRHVEGEYLDGEDILPGFKLAIDDIFDYPLDPNPTPDVTLGHNR